MLSREVTRSKNLESQIVQYLTEISNLSLKESRITELNGALRNETKKLTDDFLEHKKEYDIMQLELKKC